MTQLSVSIEGISDDLLRAYLASGMERGKGDQKGVLWAFADSPNAFAVARHDGEIAGVSAYIGTRMKFGNAVGTGLQAVDSFVSADMRGKGIFTKLARAYDTHAEEAGVDLVWGFPNANAAPAWFKKLGWHRHGQVPFLIKPLRAGIFLRKFGLNIGLPVSLARDQHIEPTDTVGAWGDMLWENVAEEIGCGTIRDQSYLAHRLVEAPQAGEYRIVADTSSSKPALVATREAEKHGGRVAYLMEALGGNTLRELLTSELGRLRDRGAEVVLAWAFPWSPNYRTLRRVGFIPLPERFRPVEIWFGSRPKHARASCANERGNWYLSYLDSDTV